MLTAYIIDNQAVARNLLGSVLTNGGHEVIGDGNISPANLARIVKLQPQIICIDIGEDEIAGTQFLDSIRTQLPKSLIFLVSSKMDANIIQTAQSRGVVGFIVKPFNTIAVLSAIKNTIIRMVNKKKTNSES